MNKNNITIGVFSALILASTIAGADQKYPAADFQPEVVFQDNDLINKKASPANAPVSAKSVKHEATVAKEEVVVDSKYPAADFKPQVVFHDEKYVPGKSVPSSKQASNLVADKADIEKPVKAKAQDSTSNYLLGLIVLGVAGFFLFKNQGKCKTETCRKTTKAYSAHPGGLTGVAKYVNRISGTGVSRYIDKNVKSATTTAKTGVAKYVAKQVVSTKAKSTDAATGVEKYMRNRG